MKLFTWSSLLSLLAFSLISVLPFLPGEESRSHAYELRVRLTTGASGLAQVYFDRGNGLSEQHSARTSLTAGPEPVDYSFPIPPGSFRAFRFDPMASSGSVTISQLRIADRDGNIVREIGVGELRPINQIQSTSLSNAGLEVATTAGANDPQLLLEFDPPLELDPEKYTTIKAWVGKAGLVFIALGLVLLAVDRIAPVRRSAGRALEWLRLRPQRAIALVALAAAVASAYPVVFLGRSFVSPNFSDGTFLLYQRFPTLPGYTDTKTENAMGSDVGAIAWHHHPLSIIEHRAIFDDGELPLWNRYDSTGVTLLGQGQSMVGDPLHLIAVAANGAAWAWDLKYVLARILFACGLGLAVYRATRHLPAAIITAFSAPFVGFFLYRVNHPAYFSFCYSPWILLSWIVIAQSKSLRTTTLGTGLLIVANGFVMTSGTVKEAYMLLLGLNFTGLIALATGGSGWRTKRGKLVILALGGALFAMLSSPVWITFLDALNRAYTTYNVPSAYQILPIVQIGLFDELFYRPIHQMERVWNPSANFLALLGVLYMVAAWRGTGPDRLRLALVVGAVVAYAMAFGIVPPQWITQAPFLGNVAHIDNCFSCVLIVHLLVLAGFGYRAALTRLGGNRARADLVIAALLLLFVFIFPFIALTQAVHRPPFGAGTILTFLNFGERLPVSPFVWGQFAALLAASVALVAVVWLRVRKGTWTPASFILIATCMAVMLWRFGQQGNSRFDDYVYNPAARVDFHAPSPAIDYIKKNSGEPFRVIGFHANLFAGWSAAYGLEGIGGPDSVVNARYRQLIDASGIERQWDWFLPVHPDTVAKNRRVYDFLNIKYYLDLQTDREKIGQSLTRELEADLDVYSSNTAWPRAFFTDRLATYENPAGLWELVRAGDGRPLAAAQAADRSGPPAMPADLSTRAIVPAGNYRLTSNTTSFEVTAPGAGLIVLHEAWLKGDFRVRVNGRRAPYFRVNHAFKAVHVDAAGTYRVEFSYWPRYLTWCLLAAGAALLFIGFVGWRIWRNSRGPGAFARHGDNLPAEPAVG